MILFWAILKGIIWIDKAFPNKKITSVLENGLCLKNDTKLC